MSATQSAANHVRLLPPFHFFIAPVFLLNIGVAVWLMTRATSFESAWGILLAVTFLVLAASARGMAMTVQDRVIRLEERLRSQSLLSPELSARFDDLNIGQVVALRFASDDELEGLVERCLAGDLKDRKAVKNAIQVWRPDHLRG